MLLQYWSRIFPISGYLLLNTVNSQGGAVIEPSLGRDSSQKLRPASCHADCSAFEVFFLRMRNL